MKWTITCKNNQFVVRLPLSKHGDPLPFQSITFLTLEGALAYLRDMEAIQP